MRSNLKGVSELKRMRSLDDIFEVIRKGERKRVALVGAEDVEALKALAEAKRMGIAEGLLVGRKDVIEKNLEEIQFFDFEIMDAEDEYTASRKGVESVVRGKASILMKGLVKTSILLKEVLKDEWNLKMKELLSHVIVMDIPKFDRLILLSDGGMVIKPNLEQKRMIIENAVEVAKKLGIDEPKVACLTAVETVNPNMPETLDAAVLSVMNRRNQIKDCTVDGPLALDNAVSERAAKIKGIESAVAGRADILITPDIHSGNMLGKSVVYFAGGKIGGVVVGAKVPIVLVSRADTMDSKLFSIALGVLMS